MGQLCLVSLDSALLLAQIQECKTFEEALERLRAIVREKPKIPTQAGTMRDIAGVLFDKLFSTRETSQKAETASSANRHICRSYASLMAGQTNLEVNFTLAENWVTEALASRQPPENQWLPETHQVISELTAIYQDLLQRRS